MSLLAEVLATAGQVEMDDLNIKINEITELISSLKIQVMETMENSYVKFIPHYEETEQLFRKAESVTDDMNDIHKRIEGQIKRDLSDSTGELKQFKDKLEISEFSLNLVNRLLKIYKCTSDAKTEQDSQKFLEASKKLNEFNSILINEGDELKCLDIYSALHEELITIQSNFSFSVLEQWRPLIKWHEVDTDFDKVSRQITLTIVDSDLKSDLIKSLHYYNLLIIEVNKFGDKLLNTILFPVINKFSVVVVTNENELESLLIEIKNKKNQSCLHVINNLTIIFQYLFKKLNVDVGDGNSFIIELGERISKKFCEHFITNCLDEAVPKRQEELNSYKGIIQNLRIFEELLHSSGFLQDDNMKLREYAENVDVLIANKICDSYLESARHLMKKDLHDTMEAGVSYKILDDNSSTHQLGVMRKIRSVRLPDSDHNVLVSELSPNTYQFPLCQISKSSYELIQLLNSLLDETAKSTTENFALKLFLTARNIFKLYCEIVPLHHKTMLNTIPQQSALLRNDCYYLAHELLMLGSLFKAKSAAVLGKHIITFVDIISSLRDVGDEILSNQLEIQQKQILDILRDSGLVTLIENPEFPQGIEKAIRQCTRQLLLLQKVWQPVLPVDTYCKTIGSLCNCFVNELVIRVCSTGDIPADTASELVRVFTIVQEKTPLVFPEPKEICQFVIRWTRFNELVRLLGANLRDVDERWADGKGPLAQEFTANQVKQMVKALFQISERRAALLARIK